MFGSSLRVCYRKDERWIGRSKMMYGMMRAAATDAGHQDFVSKIERTSPDRDVNRHIRSSWMALMLKLTRFDDLSSLEDGTGDLER